MRNVLFVLALAPVVLVAACDRPQPQGPAERAGAALDRAGTNIRDTVDPPRGPAERLGRSVDRSLN